jgi:hypothetical protein
MVHSDSIVNPSTPRHKCRGLPSTRAQAEGLRVDPERRFPSPPSKAGLSAVERVNNTKKTRRNKNAHFPFDLIYMIFQAKSTPEVDIRREEIGRTPSFIEPK